MNVTRLAATLGLALLTTSAGFIACSGDDASPSVPRPDAGPDGAADGAEPDTGTDARTEQDGRAPDPKWVGCGTTRCNTDDEFCCVEDDGGQTCRNEDTGKCQGGIEVGCDEKADCDDDEVCCGTAKFTGEISVGCAPTNLCNNPTENRHICKTHEECGDAGPCVTQTCKGIVLSTCGGIPPQACAN